MKKNDASRIIDVIDQRIARKTYSEARVETTWGTVAAIDSTGRYADLYLYGQSSPYSSDYFRLPNGISVNVGDSVKAAIDKARDDRWVEEVHTFSAYNKVEFDIVNGNVVFGDGTALPSDYLSIGTWGGVKSNGNIEAGRALIGTGYTTSNTASSDSNKWTKIASGSLSVQFSNTAFQLLLGANGSASTTWPRGIIRIRINQQGAFPTAPLVSLELLGGADISASDVVLVVTSSAGPTTWELYIRIPNTFTIGYFQPIFIDRGQQTITFHEQQGFLSSLPSGTQFVATSTDLTVNRLRVEATDDVSVAGTLHGLQVGPSDGLNMAFDPNEIMGRNNGAVSDIHLNNEGGDVRIGANGTVAYGLYVGKPVDAGGSGVLLRQAGSIEIVANAGTAFIDFKDNATEDFDARIYYVATDDRLHINGKSLMLDSGVHLRMTTPSFRSDTEFSFLRDSDGTAQVIKAKGLLVSSSFSDPTPGIATIQLGADVNLYRQATDVLTTDDAFVPGIFPGFYCPCNVSTGSLANGSNVIVSMTTEPAGTRDSFAMHSTATNPTRITVVSGLGAGLYRVDALVDALSVASSNGPVRLLVLVNGAEVAQDENYVGASLAWRQARSFYVELAVGDYVELKVQNNTGVARSMTVKYIAVAKVSD